MSIVWTEHKRLCRAKMRAFRDLIFKIKRYAPEISLITINSILAEDIDEWLESRSTTMGDGTPLPPSMSWPNQWGDIKVDVCNLFTDDNHVMICYECDIKGQENKHFNLQLEHYMED